MSWTANGLSSNQYDDIQAFSLSPGIEFKYRYFFIQVLQQSMSVNNYYVSEGASKGAQFSMIGPFATAGFTFRMANLGIGASYTLMNYKVTPNKLDLASSSADSDYVEKSYSINFVYYFGVKSGKFLKNLFINDKQ